MSETFFNEPTASNAGVHFYDEYLVCNEIKELKRTHDYIIVLYHGGAEYLQYPTPETRKRFIRMSDNGADVIISQHTHCIGCVEKYNNTFMVHGQGNFLFARQKKYPTLTKEGMIVEIDIDIQNNDLNVIFHHTHITEDECLRLDLGWDFSSLYERSKNVTNTKLIEEEYKNIKADDILVSFLDAYQGKEIFNRIYRRFFPQKYESYLVRKYNLLSLYKCWAPVKGDRRREDLYYVWKFLIDQIEKNGQKPE